ncbi:MAG: UvrD-helicase domain-containing protein [Clostridia bacterium]|nr:UvrD-helicase domain-containing protein [Clostridia bacterium]
MNLNDLNPEQRKAAETLEGPVLILAGAGSGKTRALTYRVANLIDHGVKPWHILALTFTNKAAREMKQRITQLVGPQAEEAWISTFHSSCCRILRRDIEKLGYSRSFTIYDTDDQDRLLKNIMKELGVSEKTLTTREARAIISDAKNKALGPDEWFHQSSRRQADQRLHDVYVAYEERLRELNALDFDDLLLRTLELLLQHPPVLQSYRERFQYVLVDEYQDTNYTQYQLVRLLTDQSRNLCVVGDDDQSIYSWRGADIRNILDFEKDYPETAVIRLEQNYRSTANILDAANQVIANNMERKDKRLWTETDPGEPITVYGARNERDEAAWVTWQARSLLDAGEKPGEIAVLYRSNAQSRVLEEALRERNMPYIIYGGLRFYDRKEVKDVLAYLRVLANPADDISLMRIINVPKRAIGESTVQALADHARAGGMPLFSALTDQPAGLGKRAASAVSQFVMLLLKLMAEKDSMPLKSFVTHLIEETGLKEQYRDKDTEENQSRIDNMSELEGAVSEYAEEHPGATLEEYVENIALVTDLDSQDNSQGAISLMTLHSAKGLEFNNVFITGMDEGIFPSNRSVEENREEEERRLCYVGITRARKRLFLIHAAERFLYNSPQSYGPSCFLQELPERVIRRMGERIGGPARKSSFSRSADSYGDSFGYGSSVRTAPRQKTGQPVSRLSGAAGLETIPGVTRGFVPSKAAGISPAPALPQLKAGDRVSHPTFGPGVVKRITGEGAGMKAVILFDRWGEKLMKPSVTPLTRLEEDI